MEPGDRFELRITTWDDWWPRFQPEPPVIVRYLQTIGEADHRFEIVEGGIVDTETSERLSTVSVFRSSGGPGIGHLSGVKLSGNGFGLGRALLLRENEPLPAHLG
ncbi:MAG: hypothetical protein Q8M32_02725 [Brevundimonas sp.]|nr:hypothetical protein [Brevundimonas sp.]